MKANNILFEEKQYLGHNRFSMVIRTMFALFCFVGYYWSQNPKPIQISFLKIGSYPWGFDSSGIIFFVVGISILLLSAGLTFVLHIQTTVYDGYIVLDGFWTSRKVKIDLVNIVSVRRSRYKKNIFRRAVYNLHNLGIIRFYTSGEYFIEMTDNAGFTYRIGSQKSLELFNSINNQLTSK